MEQVVCRVALWERKTMVKEIRWKIFIWEYCHRGCCRVYKLCLTLWPYELQHTWKASVFPTVSRVFSNSSPLHWWGYLTISSSIVHSSPCPQSLPESGSFPISRLFTSSGQSIRASASASVLPMNIQGWFPLGLTGLIPLLSTGLSGVFLSTTVWKHHVFGTWSSLWSNSHVHTWHYWKSYSFGYMDLCQQSIN